jgi:hypothetical protein
MATEGSAGYPFMGIAAQEFVPLVFQGGLNAFLGTSAGFRLKQSGDKRSVLTTESAEMSGLLSTGLGS